MKRLPSISVLWSKKQPGSIIFFALHVLILTVVAGSWWAGRHNTLFDNGRWTAGKNTGKYVFYAFDFMFKPLDPSGVNLSSHMGFQEIIYNEAEGPSRQLEGLACDIHLGRQSYLWVEIRKKGNRLIGIRFSRKNGYPGGFYRFDDSGEMIDYLPFENKEVSIQDGWSRLEAMLENGSWKVNLDGTFIGDYPDPGPREGQLGFRGSGNTGSPVLIKKISMHFSDPSDPGRTWTDEEDFTRPRKGTAFWFSTFLFAIAVLLMRWHSRRVFGSFMSADHRHIFYLTDDLLLSGLLVFMLLSSPLPSGVLIPAVILATEAAGLVFASRLGIKGVDPGHGRVVFTGVALGLVLAAIGALSFSRHGGWLLRAGRSGPALLSSVHPSAYLLSPTGNGTGENFQSGYPLIIEPGKPFFIRDKVFREQKITAEFIMPENCTMDVVFQQQSFLTLGDPDGEEMPYQRRLVRLTTAHNVLSGLAVSVRNRPAPFRRIRGKVIPGTMNRLEIVTDHNGVIVRLNGNEKAFVKRKPLGFGETGIMVYDGTATVHRFDVQPVPYTKIRSRLLFFTGLFLPLIMAAGAWLLLKSKGSVRFSEAAALEFSALYPIAFYLLGALFLSPEDLSFMGRERMAWLDMALAASILSHISMILLLRDRIKRPSILFNVFLVFFIISMSLLAWDMLPQSHALRLMFAGEATAPAASRRSDKKKDVPWHSDMRAIGANTYTWKQKFGGEEIPVPKPDNEFRIMLVGGSQAWGSGASSSSGTFAEMLEKNLKEKNLPIEVYNSGVNGAGIGKICELYKGLLRQFRPDLIIADIGLNDSAALTRKRGEDLEVVLRELKSLLEDLIARCRRDGADVIFVLEPICRESPLRPLEEIYQLIIMTAEKNGAAVIDPGQLFMEKEKSHMVWWDTAHFSPYGHLLMADFLEDPVEKFVRSKLSYSVEQP